MRTVSTAFQTAEASLLHSPTVEVVARPNPDALDWQKSLSNTGLTGVPEAWQGWDDMLSIATISHMGTLLRIHSAVAPNASTAKLYLNRISGGTGLPTQLQASSWTQIASDHMLVCKPAISISGTTIRVFYVRATSPLSLVYIESVNDGINWSAPVTIHAGSSQAPWNITGLASPHPDYLFSATRRFTPQDTMGNQIEWLELNAFQFSGGSWIRTTHPKRTDQIPINGNSFWFSALQFSSVFIDQAKGIISNVLVDDLSGRPASTLYQNRHWSDYYPVERIDFSEPERDEVIGYKMHRVGDKVLMSARRTQADSDFVASQQSVLYYTVDGINWSDAYFVTTGDQHAWGTPLLWRDRIWLVGSDSLWSAEPTSFFGNLTPQEVSLTASARAIRIDEPEDPQSPTAASVELDNTFRQWLNHGVVRDGGEIVVRAGHEGVEKVSIYEGRIGPPVPRADATTSTMTLNAIDQLQAFSRGMVDKVLSYPVPFRRDIRFDSDSDVSMFAQPQGSWQYVNYQGDRYMRAMKKDTNIAALGTGVTDHFRYSVNLRLVDQRFPGPEASNVWALGGAVMWQCNPEMNTYYLVRFGGVGTEGWELWKTVNGVGTMLARNDAFTMPGIDTTTYIWINRWFNLSVSQNSGRIVVTYTDETVNGFITLFNYFDNAPIESNSVVAVRAVCLEDVPNEEDQYITMDVDNVQVVSESPYTSLEDVMKSVATQRGFTNVDIEQRLDDTFTSGLGQWTQVGVSGGWSYDASGLHYNASGKTVNQYRMLRSSVFARDLLTDMDVQIGDTTTSDTVFGVVFRASSADTSRVALLVHPYYTTNPSPMIGTTILLQVTLPNGVTHTLAQRSSILCYPGQRTTIRYIADGPWYSVYIGGLHAATFYDNTLVREGYFGISDGLGTIAGITHVKSVRVPWLGLGDFPVVTQKDTLDKVLSEILSGQSAWMQANGRILRIGKTTPTSTPVNVPDIWLDGGFELSTDPVYTHCRVVSEYDGLELVGTERAINLWHQTGIPVWKFEEVSGLRNEAECRARAREILLESERNRRSRSYRVHPQLRWQKYDRINAINAFDDTSRPLIVIGMQRDWQKSDQDEWSLAMTVRLEEQNADAIVFADTFET